MSKARENQPEGMDDEEEKEEEPFQTVRKKRTERKKRQEMGSMNDLTLTEYGRTRAPKAKNIPKKKRSTSVPNRSPVVSKSTTHKMNVLQKSKTKYGGRLSFSTTCSNKSKTILEHIDNCGKRSTIRPQPNSKVSYNYTLETDIWYLESCRLSRSEIIRLWNGDTSVTPRTVTKDPPENVWQTNNRQTLNSVHGTKCTEHIRQVLTPMDIQKRTHYCEYCSQSFISSKAKTGHDTHPDHMAKVKWDKGHQWNFRQPPWNISVSDYQVCPNINECAYSSVADVSNYCKYAHSEDELIEWRERHQWMNLCCNKMLNDVGNEELCDDVSGVIIDCDKDLEAKYHLTNIHKTVKYTWTFSVQGLPEIGLKRAFLLLDNDRHLFTLKSIGTQPYENLQLLESTQESKINLLKVHFTTMRSGYFAQWLIFDFGPGQNLVRKLSIEVNVDQKDRKSSGKQKKVKQAYTTLNSRITKDPSLKVDEFTAKLLNKYKEPTREHGLRALCDVKFPVNRYNYQHKMHQLLYSEELARKDIISRYNLKTRVKLQNYIEEGTHTYAQNGELFAKIQLKQELSEDSDEGRLFLESVQTALISVKSNNNPGLSVYEVSIVRGDQVGLAKCHVYLRLSSFFVDTLRLTAETVINMNVQFQMNRNLFCKMHYAVDCLNNIDTVFPNPLKLRTLNWTEKLDRSDKSLQKLNNEQLQVVGYIAAKKDYSPPLVVYGPFGTGKTETLASATQYLLKQQPKSKILICTHTNSAADLYFTKHLDSFFKMTNTEANAVRVYAEERRSNTVPQECRQYTLFSEERKLFRLPKREDIDGKRLVVTTMETAMFLTDLGIRGIFTHIFIDEACQALESQVLMPMSLADDKTCIVLTGDHMQMNQRVYSQAAKVTCGFNVSLLERLCYYYNDFYKNQASVVNLFLRKNYRSHNGLLKFISNVFYGDKTNLECMANVSNVASMAPLCFICSEDGQEIQNDSTSFYNNAEASLIVEAVVKVCKEWPTEWGESVLEDIQVVTPYAQQVALIRSRLRDIGLKRVSVERIYNIQGKQSRIIMISTVRTTDVRETQHMKKVIGEMQNVNLGDYGFLSDRNMLNTALTRAQNCVLVVGDPSALCTIGECSGIWKRFIDECHSLGSLYSKNTYEQIKAKVADIEATDEDIQMKTLLAKSNVQANKGCKQTNLKSLEKQKGDWDRPPSLFSNNNRGLLHVTTPSDVDHTTKGSSTQRFKHGSIKRSESQHVEVDDWSDFQVTPDDIIQMLGNTLLGTLPETVIPQTLTEEASKSSNKQRAAIKYNVKEVGGKAFLYEESPDRKKRKLLGAADAESDCEYSSEDSSDDEDDNKPSKYRTEHKKDELLKLLIEYPDNYKRCLLNGTGTFPVAHVTDPSSSLKEILITAVTSCGRAFDGDEVVVKIVSETADRKSLNRNSSENNKIQSIYGRVVGILNRIMRPKLKVFICRVDPKNTTLMRPLNNRLPPILNLSRKDDHREGYVKVYNFKKYQILGSRYVKINPVNPSEKLFLVRYLKWKKCKLPLGLVIGEHVEGNNLDNGMSIIKIDHQIPNLKFSNSVQSELKNFGSCQIPEVKNSKRIDFTKNMCFTIDPPNSIDLDDALSLVKIAGDTFQVGIHIADVSHFIKEDTPLDTEAFRRGTSYYPLDSSPIHMFPPEFSTSFCSLLPNEDRSALSVIFEVNKYGEINDNKTLISKTTIRSKQRFTYAEAQEILNSTENTNEVECVVKSMFALSQIWRKKRLGRAHIYYDVAPNDGPTAEAHKMIEEFMIKANHTVAVFLAKEHPECCPLRIQVSPAERAMELFKQKHYSAASNTVSLTQEFNDNNDTCRCQGSCHCIDNYVDERKYVYEQKCSVPLTILLELCQAQHSDDWGLFKSIFFPPENYPKSLIALVNLRRIQNLAFYICSINLMPKQQCHHSLGLSHYTHFTSPIRRYWDIAVHRMLSAHIEKAQNQFSQIQLSNIARKCNFAKENSKRYERAIFSLHLSIAIEKRPLVCFPVVESMDKSMISLIFPGLNCLSSSQRKIKIGYLAPVKQPIQDEDTMDVTLEWKERIYNNDEESVTGNGLLKEIKLAAQRLMKIGRTDWQHLLNSVCADKKEESFALFKEIWSHVDNDSEDVNSDFSKEVRYHEQIVHFVCFFTRITAGMQLKVQLSSTMEKGMLTPEVQLLYLNDDYVKCLEHRRDPVSCFASLCSQQASRERYTGFEEYLRLWLPVMSMEAVTSTITQNEQMFIHKICIEWERSTHKDNHDDYCITGSFQLSNSFYEERKLNLQSAYVCVRYDGLFIPPIPNLHDKIAAVVNHMHNICFVCHCLLTDVTYNKTEETYTLNLQLQQCSMYFPDVLLKNKSFCTLEIIPQTLPSRRMKDAMLRLPSDCTSDLTKAIALGTKIKTPDNGIPSDVDILLQRQFKSHGLKALNTGQLEVIKKALSKPFTLIHGPPGTGKTVTGVYLSVYFTCRNKNRHEKTGSRLQQILYCGPSNKSVDVVAEKLINLQEECPIFVRVYGAIIENKEFPIPGESLISGNITSAEVSPIEGIRQRALHHLIRAPTNTHSTKIRKFDALFRSTKAEDVKEEDIKEYKFSLSSAKEEEILKAEIILTTCIACGSTKLERYAKVGQIIVDEAGMCTEPETMIPLVQFQKAKSIVLIGDHQQLQPILVEQRAIQLGLKTSLFERYSKQGHMLTQQYRMHTGIMEFPSKEFYDGRLQCGTEQQMKPVKLNVWPNGRLYPCVLYHTEGEEDVLTVRTEHSSEQSKSNDKEANCAVRVAINLVKKYRVKKEDIMILSQYRAQCQVISNLLKLQELEQVGVSTVVSSQGSEWKYIIFSTVRSLPEEMLERFPSQSWIKNNLGFISDDHQINVAITRAKEGLIIIGNKHLLSCHSSWSDLVHFYEERNMVIDADTAQKNPLLAIS